MREALAALLVGVPDLKTVSAFMAPMAALPGVSIAQPTTLREQGVWWVEFPVRVLVAQTAQGRGEADLDDFVAVVTDAIEADQTWGGAARGGHVISTGPEDTLSVSSVPHFSVTITARAMFPC